MAEKQYFISEVSKIVGVEPHVLRYWEEELQLKIQRNTQGKRCYTEQDVDLLSRIKYWKDKGMQLKAVKEVLEADIKKELSLKKEDDFKENTDENINEDLYELSVVEKPEDPMQRLEQILDLMIGRALERNNEKLVREFCDAIIQELEEKLEVRIETLMQQEFLKEMLRESEREAAVTDERQKKGIIGWWKRWLEKYI